MKTRTTLSHLSGSRLVSVVHATEAKDGKPCRLARDVRGSCCLWSHLGDEELKAAVARHSGVKSVVVTRY